MTTRTGPGFPAAADAWLIPQSNARVLAVGRGTTTMAVRLATRGARVTLVDADVAALLTAQRKAPALSVVGAIGEALPFQPCSFDEVVVAQGVPLLTAEAVLAELARVLVPDGVLAVAHTARDDSVPWVRRLACMLQAHDPELMTSQELSPDDAVPDTPYFPEIEYRSFRLWAPVTRDGMLAMVAGAPSLASLPQPDADALLDQVGALYDASAKAPDPLTLPYAVQCWRSRVDHSEFTSQLDLTDDALHINL